MIKMKIKHKILLVSSLLCLAEYNASYTEKKLVWIGVDMGWSALRTLILLGSGIALFAIILYIIERVFGR